jgi:hypothetical protein
LKNSTTLICQKYDLQFRKWHTKNISDPAKIVNNFPWLGLKMSKPWCYFIQRDVRNDFSMAVSLSEAVENQRKERQK